MHVENQHPVLGIDHGEARIGLAITDPFGILASPLETIQVQQIDAITRIGEIVKQREVKQIVLGLPLRMDGSEGTATEKIHKFAAELRAELPETPLHLMDERFTTVSASEKLRASGKKARDQKQFIDQAAAVEILNDWLEHNNLY